MNRHFNHHHLDLLIQAFKKDPMFIKLFYGPKKEQQMASFFKFIYKRNQLMAGKYLSDSDHAPTYVAFLERPKNHKSIVKNIKLKFEMFKLLFHIPYKSLNFLSKYDKITLEHRPNKDHYYLTMIGVNPQKQGQGIGKKVIETIHQLVKDDAKAASICLDTENYANVVYYKYLGYVLTHQEKIDDLTIYCMEKIIS